MGRNCEIPAGTLVFVQQVLDHENAGRRILGYAGKRYPSELQLGKAIRYRIRNACVNRF
jgi:hypothetical protein